MTRADEKIYIVKNYNEINRCMEDLYFKTLKDANDFCEVIADADNPIETTINDLVKEINSLYDKAICYEDMCCYENAEECKDEAGEIMFKLAKLGIYL